MNEIKFKPGDQVVFRPTSRVRYENLVLGRAGQFATIRDYSDLPNVKFIKAYEYDRVTPIFQQDLELLVERVEEAETLIYDKLTHKQCYHCDEVKPLTEYYFHNGRYGNPCKVCRRAKI